MSKTKSRKNNGWVFLLIGLAILVYLGWFVIPMVHCYFNGTESVAEVIGTSIEQESTGLDSSRQVHYYKLAFDGHTVRKRASGERDVGDRFPVIYLPDNPNRVVRGTREEGLWNMLKLSTNERNLLIATGIALFLLLNAVVEFRKQ